MNTRSRRCTLVAVSVAMLLAAGLAAPAGAAVVVTLDTSPITALDLTALGGADWVHLGNATDTSRNEKAGADLIGIVVRDGTNARWAATDYEASWTDGSPIASATSYKSTWESKPFNTAHNPALSFDVTGPAGQYTMVVYATTYINDGTLTATVSGGGPTDNAQLVYSTSNHGSFAVDFNLSTGESLNVTYRLSSGTNVNRNVGISAITLVPEPSTLALAAVGLLGLRRRRRA